MVAMKYTLGTNIIFLKHYTIKNNNCILPIYVYQQC